MLIEVRCPNGHVLHVKGKHAGKMGACPRCSAPIRVPVPTQTFDEAAAEIVFAPPPPSQDVLQQDFRSDAADRTSDSSSLSSSSGFLVAGGKGKLCLACGKNVPQSFSNCTRCGTPVSAYRHLEVWREQDAIHVKFGKHQILDERAVKEVSDELLTVADRVLDHDLVLNLSKVVGLSSLMLGKLVMLQKKMELKGHHLKLCNVGPEVREVLAATKLDRILRIQETET